MPLGWQVAVEAEPSRFIDFGNRVLDKMLLDDAAPEEDWHAAVVFLGSNYGGDEVRYEAELVRILDRLAPRPTLLLTVTEYRPDYVEVNEVVNRLGAERDNVTVLDWRTISETPGVLSSDRLHPTDAGRRVLAESVAAALGQVDGVGECLRSTFRDDSRVGGNTTTVLGQPSTGSGSSSATTSTTVRPTTSAPEVNPSSTVATPASTVAPSTTRPPTSPTTTAAPTPTTPLDDAPQPRLRTDDCSTDDCGTDDCCTDDCGTDDCGADDCCTDDCGTDDCGTDDCGTGRVGARRTRALIYP